MHRLMMRTLMDEASGGESLGGGGAPQEGGSQGAAPDGATDGAAGGAVGGDAPAPAPDGADKPFLGDGAKNADADAKPTPASEEDYTKAMVKDEAIFGDNKALQFDSVLVKAMIPKAQELGVSPENMGKLANALAKAQIDEAREKLKDRIDYFNKMKNESLQKYSPKDFEQINSGIDHWFKPGGVMNNVIRNSELGADPEFLALMHHLGAAAKMDGLAGAASSGGGGGSTNPNGIDGLAKMW